MKVRIARLLLRVAHRTKNDTLILVATIRKPKLIARGKWTPVTITQFEGFPSAVINMGIISVPVLRTTGKRPGLLYADLLDVSHSSLSTQAH